MTTTSFTISRAQIIASAMRACGRLGEGATPTTEDTANASEALNLMIKFWMAKGTTLWKIQELTVPLISGLGRYPIGPQAGYVRSIPVTNGGTGYTGGSTISLSAPGGYSGFAGTTATASLVLSGSAIQSVTITNGGAGYQAAPTITLGAPGSGATFGTPVMAGLTSTLPLKILDQGNFVRNTTTALDTPITLISRDEYESLGNKAAQGSVNSFFPDIQRNAVYVNVYTVPDVSNSELHLFAQLPYTDTVDPADILDFPQEWLNALRWGLARELIPEYGVDETTERRIESRYAEAITTVFNWSQEEAPIRFVYSKGG